MDQLAFYMAPILALVATPVLVLVLRLAQAAAVAFTMGYAYGWF